ncbi:TonB-dependent receptor plug domain-containing protein [Rivibacter subsaxonicus]|uniref:Iron complex outermembrane receptor protein n=1 Tax=Rivibacter subsaxonicus TaxID=457575 RepID=A0A4Q7VG92_9BURK|nr:TonB-dependent receptor [Rivibacter subsaxonicus]RZT95014.1 iron complex outermembrane receptor protein [Rivibacter subsaxonicus]
MRPHPLALALLATGAIAQEPVQFERVEVVGSRLPRIDAETALPVQIIRREQIERSGAQNAEELLQRIVANAGGHPEALGLGEADTPGLSSASLRGLGTGETLVLLNGRRLANYAFTSISGPGVDLHVIPLAAIERVEVLKDGASALYGSDAIGGVINFVTRKDFSGAELGLSARAPEAGGAERGRATLAFGRGDLGADGYNAFAIVDLQRTRGLAAIDRPFASTGNRPELGLVQLSGNSWPANIRQFTPGGGQTLVNPAAPGCTSLTVPFDSDGNGVADTCGFDFVKTLNLVAPSRQANLLASASVALGSGAELYTELLWSDSEVRFVSSPSSAIANLSGTGSRFFLPASSPYYPTELGLQGNLPLAYRTLPLGSRTNEVDSENLRALVGARGRRGGWDFDGALSFKQSRAQEHYASGFVDAGRLSAALATGLVNPFGASGPEGDALLAGTELTGLAREARGRSVEADLRASGELLALPGGMLALATGVEARRETLTDRRPVITDEVAGSGGPSGEKSGSRNVQALYAELLAPVLTGLELQAAARLDHYSDFGSNFSPKLALRWQPAAWGLLRASAGRGFRAPSLPELYTEQTSSLNDYFFAEPPVTDPVRCPVTGQPADCQPEWRVVGGGNPALQPQRSTQTNLGIVLEPSPGWQASLDIWSIRISDIIGTLTEEDVIYNIPGYEGSNVVRGPVDPAFPALPGPIEQVLLINQNLGTWRVEGTDLHLASAPVSTPLGRASAQFDGSYVRRARQEIVAGQVIDLIGRVVPRWQHVLSMGLDLGAWKGTLSQRYRRGYRDERPLPDGSTRRVSSYVNWDAQLGYAPTPALTLTLGVQNLLDRDPPFTNSGANFQLGYDPLYASPLGRTWTLGVKYAWR